jgi:crossover junction endodeoxyribonuclease RuvC
VIVLGIDPGTRHFGWGIVKKIGTRLAHVAHGVIEPDERAPIASRLVVIERELSEVVRAHAPNEASVEALFFAKDAQAAAKLGHARGVALLVCARAGLPIGEYPPARVKRTVAGGGRADKQQVAQMIRVLLGLRDAPVFDAADALALAVTHLQQMGMAALMNPAQALLERAARSSKAAGKGGFSAAAARRDARLHTRKVSPV